jgi:hypothetical protein
MKTIFNPGIDKLLSDRQCFNSFVYTPVEQAVKELEYRKGNNQNLPFGFPQHFEGEKNAVLGRQIASPNFELMKFSSVADSLPGFKKIVLEMHIDKFTPNVNATKYHLGKIVFNDENDQNGKTKSIMAVDFNENSGKKLSEVKTIWGQRFVDFHSEFLEYCLSKESSRKINQLEASQWVFQAGKSAKEYYPKYLSLFLQNGILFENFLMKEKNESTFTKEVFLPAFIKIMQETGVKPLIVSFLPIESEGSNYWNHYSADYFEFIRKKMEVSEIIRSKVAA